MSFSRVILTAGLTAALTAGVIAALLLNAAVAAADTAPADPTPLPLPVPDSSQATPETDPTQSVNESLEKRAKNYWEEHFIDPEDGAFDISQFLATRSGFLAGPIILTEPTLGYGGGASLLFLQPREDKGEEGYRRPDITLGGGLATENGTWAGFIGDLRHWRDGQVRTVVGGMSGRVRLDFFGLGPERITRGKPIGYQLDIHGGRAGAQYRITDTNIWVGASYQYAVIDATFDAGSDLNFLPDIITDERKTRLSGLLFRATYDSRNSIFTPTRGHYAQIELATGFEALGGSTTYQILDFVGITYREISDRISLGLRLDAEKSLGSPPFYLEPALAFEGLPAMRYQGRTVIQGQGQATWRFWKRLCLVGFMGGGGAWKKDALFNKAKTAYAGGAGLRYELARRFKLSYGIDYAWGPDGGIFYVVVGSAWKFPGSGI